MNTFVPTYAIADLADRVAELERRLEAGEESLSPGVYSINAKGEVEAKISGTLEAAGIIFKELLARPNPTGEILWVNPAGKARELIAGTASGVHHSLLGYTQPTAATFANFTLEAAEDNSSAAALLQASRESQIGRLTIGLSATSESLALELGEHLSGLEILIEGGVTTFKVTAGGETHKLLDSTGASDWIIFPGFGVKNEVLRWISAGKAAWSQVSNAVIEPAAGIEESKLSLPNVVKAAGGLITNANVAAAAAIAESKLNLPNVVTLTGGQTITGTKLFTPPAAPSTEENIGEPGIEAIIVTAGAGGICAAEEAAVGGGGGILTLETGPGGAATKATVAKGVGGEGGKLTIKAGAGGASTTKAGPNNEGGRGGLIEMVSGAGGAAEGAEGGKREGGPGGIFRMRGGTGGTAITGTGARLGGRGGAYELSGGAGGAGGTEGGPGGSAIIGGGNAGAGGAAAGGNVELNGGTASTTALAGSIVFKTGKTGALTERLKITGEGAANFTKGIGLFGKAAPAAQPAEITPEEITVKALTEKLNTLFKAYGLTA